MGVDDSTFDYEDASRQVYARRSLGDVVLVSMGCVRERDDPEAAVCAEAQQELSDEYHREKVLEHKLAFANPVMYQVSLYASPIPVDDDAAPRLRYIITELVQNARRATMKVWNAQDGHVQDISTSEFHGPAIDVLLRKRKNNFRGSEGAKEWYELAITNYGSRVPGETLRELGEFGVEYRKNGKGDALTKRVVAAARKAKEKSGEHGGLGLLLSKAKAIELGGNFMLRNLDAEDAVEARLCIPYVLLHPEHNPEVSPAPRPGMSLPRRQAQSVQTPGPLVIREDTQDRYKDLFYRKE